MLLEIKNLNAGYGDLEVLHDISVGVDAGEAVVLIGPNGAGKTTVLKSVVGLTNKISGTIVWKGRDITKLPTHALLEQGVGFVPQGRLVFSTLTVHENLEVGGHLLNHKETRKKNLEQVLTRFPDLRTKLKERAGTLSGGQQQMLAIGRALMMTPTLLMLDEPSLGLSPKATLEMFEKLKEIQVAGTTLLIVEQNVRLALRHVDRGYLLAAGQVRFAGSAKELGSEKLMHDAYLV
jgi:branched-chain amino acid transport system ATP-binding protein